MAYLMAHFIGEQIDGEQVYFSVSRDGLYWDDLSIRPVLKSGLGEGGVRDPFVIKCPDSGAYYLIATDLRIQAGKGWHAAQFEGSRDIIIWKSKDLISWGEPWNATIAPEGAGCAWAPESIYDYELQAFFVFWASMVDLGDGAGPKQRMYGSYTSDFMSFTPAEIYVQAENHVIDLTIVHENGWYYRFVKDETKKVIKADKAQHLHADKWIDIEVAALYDHPVEGAQAYRLPDGKWCLIVDRFIERLGYLPLVCTSLDKADFRILADDEYDFGKLKKRHGSVIEISELEMESLIKGFYS